MPNHRLYSNSSLSDFNLCPRLFYFRYILGWGRDGKQLPLVFGSGWHRAMDVIWTRMIAGDDVGDILHDAFAAFMEEWLAAGLPPVKDIGPELLKEYGARHPMNAMEMLMGYIAARANFIRGGEVEIIETEKAFAIPLDPDEHDLFYVGKIDKVILHKPYNKVRGMEHKTTTSYKKSDSKGNGAKFKSSFLESFSPNSQVDGYLYALHMFFPGKVGGVWVDGSLVHKTEQDFVLIPIEHQMQHIELWLWETRVTVDEIEANLRAVDEANPRDKYLPAFRRDTRSCYNMYGASCPYLIPCKAWANPKGKDIPKGFVEKPWNPMEHLKMELPTDEQ